MSSVSERTSALSSRVASASGERPRELQEVALMMSDGTEIRGMLHRHHGLRTLDFLNHQTEGFVAMTDATLFNGEHTEHVSFIAINKAHITRVIEGAEAD